MQPLTDHPGIQLLHEGAVFVSDCRTLVVADIHLGKSAVFRARGLPVPEGDTARDLGRLLAMVKQYKAAHLVIAGDLFHAPLGITPELEIELQAFLIDINIPVTLVLGNHDLKLREVPHSLNSVTHLDLGETLRIIHDPDHATNDRLHISGHWHPVVKIRDGARTSIRLPCFFLRGNTLVMPAFGSFTGGAVMDAKSGDRVFALVRDQVVELPESLVL
jgi:uncharacterized protein